MNPAHNPKDFEKRNAIEIKKAQDMAAAMTKVKKSLDTEKKVYTVDYAKFLAAYAEDQTLPPQIKAIL